MIIGLILILLITLFLPLLSKKVEHNLELFLFIVGFIAALISGVFTKDLIIHIFENKFLYLIAIAVLGGGVLFKIFNKKFIALIEGILRYIPLRIFIFLTIVLLGLASSIITAIIAALLLVEIISLLPLDRKRKISINIIACFSIGLGAVLTPIGEPLSTIVVSKLNADFLYTFNLLGGLIIPAIILLGILGALYSGESKNFRNQDEYELKEEENYKVIIVRTLKIFIFIIALELLGAGFKPLIDTYIVNLHSGYLYWINLTSAVLDNATLASAEISTRMTEQQIKVILMGLLISGGMMIPGNIPNIISANKLKIKSSEWIALGLPLGAAIMMIFYIILFVI